MIRALCRKACAVLMSCALIVGAVGVNSIDVNADASTADPNNYTTKWHKTAAYQYKDVFESETVKVNDITCRDNTQYSSKTPAGVEFIFFNTVTQEVEKRVKTDEKGVIRDLYLKKNHNYMIYTTDDTFCMSPAYVWVVGNQLKDIKSKQFGNPAGTYDDDKYNDGELDNYSSITLYQRNGQTDSQNRFTTRELKITIGSQGMAAQNVEWTLTSQYETLSGETDKYGKIKAELLEDIAYTLTIKDKTIDNKVYTVDTIPIVVKDHSERKFEEGYEDLMDFRYTYDHRSCASVSDIPLVLKSNAHSEDTTVTSYNSGNTSVSGINFKHQVVCEQLESMEIPSLEDGTYDVVNIKMVNPHRWEVSKICAGNFTITEKIGSKDAEAVYELQDDGSLKKLEFTQAGSVVKFSTNSLSIHPVVIQYAGGEGTTEEPVAVTPVVTLDRTAFTYDGKAKTPAVKVAVNDTEITEADYEVAYPEKSINAGSYTVKVTLKGRYTGEGTAKYTIAKATPKMTVKATTKTLRKSAVKKSAKTVTALTVKNAKGKVSYKKISGSKYLKINAKTGKVTCTKHKCAKKTKSYKIKVKVSCAGNANYKALNKYVYVTVKMK